MAAIDGTRLTPSLLFSPIKFGLGTAFTINMHGETAGSLARVAQQSSTMMKRSGNFMKGWEERYVVLLQTTLLLYFESPDDTEPRGLLSVTRDSIVSMMDKYEDRPHVLKVEVRPTTAKDSRILYLAAPDAGAATDWCKALYTYRPEVLTEQVKLLQSRLAEAELRGKELEETEFYAKKREEAASRDAAAAMTSAAAVMRALRAGIGAGSDGAALAAAIAAAAAGASSAASTAAKAALASAAASGSKAAGGSGAAAATAAPAAAAAPAAGGAGAGAGAGTSTSTSSSTSSTSSTGGGGAGGSGPGAIAPGLNPAVTTAAATLQAAVKETADAVAAALTELRTARETLQRDVKSVQTEAAEARRAQKAAEERAEASRADAEKATKRSEDAIAALRKLVADREATATAVASQEAEWKSREARYRDGILKLEAATREAEDRSLVTAQQLRTTQQEVDRLRSEVTSLREAVAQAEAAYRQAAIARDNSLAQTASYQHGLAEANAQIAALQSALAGARASAAAAAAAAGAAVSGAAGLTSPISEPVASHAVGGGSVAASAFGLPPPSGGGSDGAALPSIAPLLHAPIAVAPASDYVTVAPVLSGPLGAIAGGPGTGDRSRAGSIVQPTAATPDAAGGAPAASSGSGKRGSAMSLLWSSISSAAGSGGTTATPGGSSRALDVSGGAAASSPAGGIPAAAAGPGNTAATAATATGGSGPTMAVVGSYPREPVFIGPAPDVGSSGSSAASAGGGAGGTASAGGGSLSRASITTAIGATAAAVVAAATGTAGSGGARGSMAAPASAMAGTPAGLTAAAGIPQPEPATQDLDILADPFPGRLYVFIMASRHLPETAFGSFGSKASFVRVHAFGQPDQVGKSIEVVDRGRGKGLSCAYHQIMQFRVTQALPAARLRLDVYSSRSMRGHVFMGGATVDVSSLEDWQTQPHAVWLVLHVDEARASRADPAEVLIPVAANADAPSSGPGGALVVSPPAAGATSSSAAAVSALAEAGKFAMPELPPPPVDTSPCLLVQLVYCMRKDQRPRFHMPVSVSGETPAPPAALHAPAAGAVTPYPGTGSSSLTHRPSFTSVAALGSTPPLATSGGAATTPPTSAGSGGVGTAASAAGGFMAHRSGMPVPPALPSALASSDDSVHAGVFGLADLPDKGEHDAGDGGGIAGARSVSTGAQRGEDAAALLASSRGTSPALGSAAGGGGGEAAALSAQLATLKHKLATLAQAYKELTRDKAARDDEVAKLTAECEKWKAACRKLMRDIKQLQAGGGLVSRGSFSGGGGGTGGGEPGPHRRDSSAPFPIPEDHDVPIGVTDEPTVAAAAAASAGGAEKDVGEPRPSTA